MGKQNFIDIYTQACLNLDVSRLSVKISNFSDTFDANKNYAGLIVYHHKGKYKWKNTTGVAKGYNCRTLYVLILCTDTWPTTAFKRAGQGMVHDYLYKQMFGRSACFRRRQTCCGGFSILKGDEVRYSSKWLNKQSSSRTSRMPWASDGNKVLSTGEETLVDLAVMTWKNKGPNSIVDVPKELHTTLFSASDVSSTTQASTDGSADSSTDGSE